MRRPTLNLERLLHPVAREEFFSSHWETAPLHVRRGEPATYDSLLALSDLDYLVSLACHTDGPAVESLGDPAGADGEVRAHARAVEVYEAYGRGATVRINGVQRFWKPLEVLSRKLEQTFGCPVAVNLYSTPARSQGARRHYDNHDIFVLQLSGRKTWRVYDPLVRLPLKHLPLLPFEGRGEELKYFRGGPKKGRADIGDADTGSPTHEFALEQGDLLYLPRGYVHEAFTVEESSVHLTVGLHVLTWLDLFAVALGQVAQRDERFRKALPAGLLHDDGLADANAGMFAELVEVFSKHAGPRDALAEVAESFVRSRQAVGDGVLAEKEDVGASDLDTPLERRPGLICRLRVDSEGVGLASAQSALWMPKSFYPALSFVARTDEFRVGDIPGGLSENGKLALARRLVEDGFLRITRDE